MLSPESLPRPVARAAALTQRFQKFLLVGAIGLAVNQGALFALVDLFGVNLVLASPIAILISMAVTFTLNERWTWHDRGRGRILDVRSRLRRCGSGAHHVRRRRRGRGRLRFRGRAIVCGARPGRDGCGGPYSPPS